MKKGKGGAGVIALLALSAIKFTPYGEQCVREWRGQKNVYVRDSEKRILPNNSI